MIKNEREYRITKAQAKEFAAALDRLRAAPPSADIHPLIAQAEVDALQSQLDELREQLRAYEALRDRTTQLTITAFDELPEALIKARIASGLSHKELASKLGIAEQQIQRYEATKYKGASFERINAIINALKVRVHKHVYLPTSMSTVDALYTRAQELGLDRAFLLDKLLTPQDRAVIEHADAYADDDTTAVASAAATLDRIFDLPPGGFLSSTPPTLQFAPAQFKVPARLGKGFTAYTAYARYLARVVLHGHDTPQSTPPGEPDALRRAIIERHGALTLHATLQYTWDLGIPVLPLHYRGTFHGACWREHHRHVIVLKQRTASASRWLNDLIHELAHTTQHPGEADFAIVETGDSPLERANTREEEHATEFASAVLLDGRQDELAEQSVEEANGKLEFLKRATERVAEREKVDVGALANYLAYRLSQQGENWWGAATNLQARDDRPWEVARDVFCQRMSFTNVSGVDQALLNQALRT